jgi:D-serine deaminase-like pyridoxal phosphate-dependent protein
MGAADLFPELPTPSLLLEQAILESNIRRMQRLADMHGVALRPHIKTHKSLDLARRQLKEGAVGIAVAKLGEAEVMAAGGIVDIQIANQVVGVRNIDRLVALASRARVSCAVDSIGNAQALSGAFADGGKVLTVMLDIDTGLHRCGLSDHGDIKALAAAIDKLPGLSLKGLLTHAGHAYAGPPENIAALGREEGETMVRLAGQLRADGFTLETISVGSTPTAPHAVAIAGVTELRPGNYVFHDMIQVGLGVATQEQCALSILATVISTPTTTRAVIDAGSKALSSDMGAHGNRSVIGYGRVVGSKLTVTRLSEEHGVIEHTGEDFRVGQRVRIIPNHACAVVNLFDVMYLCDVAGVIAEWPVHARGRSD